MELMMTSVRSLPATTSRIAALALAVTTLSLSGLAMAAISPEPEAYVAQVDVVASTPATEAATHAQGAAGAEAPAGVTAASEAATSETEASS